MPPVRRAPAANPFIYRQLRDNIRGPRRNDCNACVGLIGTEMVDCYHPRIRREKEAMLAAAT